VDLGIPTYTGLIIPTHTDAVTWRFCRNAGCRRIMILIRDEEAVGSNPATPTRVSAGQARPSAQEDRADCFPGPFWR